MLKKVLKVAYDHWLVVLSVILSFMGLSGILTYWESVKKVLHTVIEYPLSGWIASGILVVAIIIYWFVKKISKKKRGGVYFGLCRPRYRKNEIKRVELHGVLWDTWLGSDWQLYLDGEDGVRLWADGPFCPRKNCLCKLIKEDKKWLCVKCNSKFSIPKNIQSDTQGKVIQIFESELKIQQSQTK